MDWGSTGLVAIALYQAVYLWDSGSGSVTDLLSQITNMNETLITSVKWITCGNHIAIGLSNGTVEVCCIIFKKWYFRGFGHWQNSRVLLIGHGQNSRVLLIGHGQNSRILLIGHGQNSQVLLEKWVTTTTTREYLYPYTFGV